MATKIIKFGLVGCGRISRQHISSLKVLEEENLAKLVAVSDINLETAKKVGEELGIPYYNDYKEMLRKEDVDVVSIATPNGTHYSIAKDCALFGKHVLIEKPITINLKEADELINLFKSKNLHLFTVLQVRYNPSLQIVKKLIEEGKLGKLLNAAVVVRWTRPQEYFKGWRGTRQMDGGTVINQGIHYLDILQWLLGPVDTVYAMTDTVAHKIEIEDEAVAIMRFKSNVLATYEFTINTYPKNMECSITILGTKGTIKIGGTAMNKIEYWQVEGVEQPSIEERNPNVYANGMYVGSCPNHIYIYRDVVRILKEGGTNYISGEEGKKALEIVKAIYSSAKQKRPVKFLD